MLFKLQLLLELSVLLRGSRQRLELLLSCPESFAAVFQLGLGLAERLNVAQDGSAAGARPASKGSGWVKIVALEGDAARSNLSTERQLLCCGSVLWKGDNKRLKGG